MRVSAHAHDRILNGDKLGPRTKLSADEIVKVMQSGIAVQEHPGRYVFYSVKDEKCIGIAVRNNTIVTVFPAEKMDVIARIRAEKKVRGRACLIDGDIPEPKTRQRQDAGWFELRYVSEGKNASIERKIELTHWFHLRAELFRSIAFLEILRADLETALELEPPGIYKPLLYCRGNGWYIRVPLELPYELLDLEVPFAKPPDI